MIKTIKIGGMSCSHCAGRVDRALNQIPGVHATVDLEKKTATITSDSDIDDAAVIQAVIDAGYTVPS